MAWHPRWQWPEVAWKRKLLRGVLHREKEKGGKHFLFYVPFSAPCNSWVSLCGGLDTTSIKASGGLVWPCTGHFTTR